MSLFFDFVIIALTATGILHVWLKGSIFAYWRDYFEVRKYNNMAAELLLCRLCLSVWLIPLISCIYFCTTPEYRWIPSIPAGVALVHIFSQIDFT